MNIIDANARRWYDQDPILSKSMNTLENSNDETQIKIALNLIKIIIEHNITNSQFTEVQDIIQAVEDGKTPRGIGRWYDLDTTVRTAINMLENCPLDAQKKIAVEMAKEVVQKINDHDDSILNDDEDIDSIEDIDDTFDDDCLQENDVDVLTNLFSEK